MYIERRHKVESKNCKKWMLMVKYKKYIHKAEWVLIIHGVCTSVWLLTRKEIPLDLMRQICL